MRMVDIDDSGLGRDVGKSTLTPTTKMRRIHLCVDALSAKMFRSLKWSLTRKLTEIGSAEYVEALLTALDSFTCQHDYLHEHRMHRQDVIWRQFYGCVLQAFQAETRTLRINGDPVKNNLQSHEAFLEICYRALKRHRMNRFMEQHGEFVFAPMEGESERELLLRWDQSFVEYCTSWENSDDEPIRICNNLIKMLDGYFRSVHAVHKRDFWLCKVENIIWQGAYKASGKNNYAEEAMHRIDTLYGLDGMTDVELENFRANRFFLMTALGDCMSLDEVNELLNLWFKKCLLSPTFQINVDRSKHIMCLMKCGYETFGKKSKRSSRTSQEENVEKIVLLLERTNVYPSDHSSSRLFDDNFFWREVKIPRASGTDRDKNKEDVVIGGAMKGLYNVMCVAEDVRPAYSELEEEEEEEGATDDVGSVVSSVADVEPSNPMEEDHSDAEEEVVDTEKRIQTSLKRIGNVQRKRRSPLLMKELLGVDGDDAMHGAKEKHLRSLARMKSRIDCVKLVNRHFECKIQRRMKALSDATTLSKTKQFVRRNRRWKTKFKEVMIEKRNST